MSWVIRCFNPQDMLNEFYEQQAQEIPLLNSFERIEEKRKEIEIRKNVLHDALVNSLAYRSPDRDDFYDKETIELKIEETMQKIEQLVKEQIWLIKSNINPRQGKPRTNYSPYTKYITRYRRSSPFK